MILTKYQAASLITAMAALKNMGCDRIQLDIGPVLVDIGSDFADDKECMSILQNDRPNGLKRIAREDYDTQADFAAAYGLSQA